MRGEYDDERCRPIARCEGGEEAFAVESWHLQVEEDDHGLEPESELLERVDPIHRPDDIAPRTLECEHSELADIAFVVDDEDPERVRK